MKSSRHNCCEKCSEGYKKIIRAGAWGKPYRMLCTKTLLCVGDLPGTKYDRFLYELVPCICEKGREINQAFDKFKYDMSTLKKIAVHSFSSEGKAIDFLVEKDLIEDKRMYPDDPNDYENIYSMERYSFTETSTGTSVFYDSEPVSTAKQSESAEPAEPELLSIECTDNGEGWL